MVSQSPHDPKRFRVSPADQQERAMERKYGKNAEPVPGYKLVKFLGRGGFGEVWKATGPGGASLAIKIINLGNKQGFKEFRAIRRFKDIRHPNLVPIVGFWLKDANGHLFDDGAEGDSSLWQGKADEMILAMGLGDKSLQDCLREHKAQGHEGIPPAELLGYMDEAAKAIDFLNRPSHKMGSGPVSIHHCDIKPQNILVVGDAIQVCDFGLARELEDVRNTATDWSVAYAAPEFIQEERPSPSTDQYSLAISYFELRTGQLPYTTKTPAAVIYAKTQGLLDLSRLPAAEQTVIQRATSREPDKRYPSCQDMVKDLRRAFEPTATRSRSRVSVPVHIRQPGSEVVPGYRLVRLLGRGGYGEVWEALSPGGILVAIKIIDKLQGAGKQEFKALKLIKNVQHEYLLDLHGLWLLDAEDRVIPDEAQERPDPPAASMLVVATKLAGKNLLDRLAECQKEGQAGLPPAELLGYMRQAAEAIDYLNECRHPLGDQLVSIQHRDIKPDNILLARGMVKVGDFGLAKVVEGLSAPIHAESTGFTPHYAAPELYKGSVSRWTDQYSLALTYFKLRTGTLPFDANSSPFDLLLIHTQGKLDLEVLPEAERAVIARATAVVAEERFPTCSDMVRALEAAFSGGALPVPPPPVMDVPLRAPTPRPVTPTTAWVRSVPEDIPTRPQDVAIRDKVSTVAVVPPLASGPKTQETPPPLLVPTLRPGTPPPATRSTESRRSAVKADSTRPAPVERSASSTETISTTRISLVLVAVFAIATGVAGVIFWKLYQLRQSQDTQGRHDTTQQQTASERATGPTRPHATKSTEVAVTSPAGSRKGNGSRPPAPNLVEGAVKEAERSYGAGNAYAALEHFAKAMEHANKTDFAPFRRRIFLGQAQAFACLEPKQQVQAKERLDLDWPRIEKNLSDLPEEDRKGNDYRWLAWLAKAGTGGDAEKFLDELIEWKKQDLPVPPPLGKALEVAKGRIRVDLSARIDAVLDHLPDQLGEMDNVFGLADKIAAYEAEWTPTPAERRSKAAATLLKAAQQERTFSSDDPFKNPYPGGRVAKVHDWLRRAFTLAETKPPVPQALRAELALAAWYKAEPESRGDLLDDYQASLKTQPQAFLFLLVKARTRPQTLAGRKTAFGCYQALYEALKTNKKILPRELDAEILGPAITCGKKILDDHKGPGPLRGEVARLLGARGDLMRKNLPFGWTITDALGAYNEAIGLDDQRAEFFVGKALAYSLSTPDVDLVGIEEAASQARKLDPDQPYAHERLAFVFFRKAKESSQRDERAQYLKSATDSYSAAIAGFEKNGDPDKDLPDTYLARSDVYILAYWAGKTNVERADLLTKALKDAEEASRLKHPKPHLPLLTQAIILEDFAYYGIAPRYRDAVDAYTRAIEETDKGTGEYRVKYLLDRGRCNLRWAEYGKDDTRFDYAQRDLKEAADAEPTDVFRVEHKAEACYWLGRTYARRRPPDYVEAEHYLEQAKKTDRPGLKAFFGPSAQGELARIAMERCKKAAESQDEQKYCRLAEDRAKNLADMVLARADVEGFPDLFDVLLSLGHHYEEKNKPVAALRIYEIGLPQDIRGKARAAHLPFLNARNMLLARPNSKAALEGHVAPEDLVSQADYAVTLARSKDVHPSTRSRTHEVAGYCYNQAATVTEKAKYRKICIERFEEVLKLNLDKAHPNKSLWRVLIGEQCVALAEKDADPTWVKKGRENLEKALKSPPQNYTEEYIQDLLKKLRME
jgi:serine/threonine protein kinase